MKRLIALSGALVLALAMAAPAAANQKVFIEEFSGADAFEVEVSFSNPEWFGPFECAKPIYYGGTWKGNLWLWYPKSVDTTNPDEYMPVGRAWPWIKGKADNSGTDYFSTRPNKSGKVISGKYKGTTRLYDHVIGNPESWKFQDTGKFWGVNAPGKGTVFHESGNFRGMNTIVFENGEIVDEIFDFIRFRGNSIFDEAAVCDALGAGPIRFRD